MTGLPAAANVSARVDASTTLQYLQDNLRSYTMTPTLGLALGYDIGL